MGASLSKLTRAMEEVRFGRGQMRGEVKAPPVRVIKRRITYLRGSSVVAAKRATMGLLCLVNWRIWAIVLDARLAQRMWKRLIVMSIRSLYARCCEKRAFKRGRARLGLPNRLLLQRMRYWQEHLSHSPKQDQGANKNFCYSQNNLHQVLRGGKRLHGILCGKNIFKNQPETPSYFLFCQQIRIQSI